MIGTVGEFRLPYFASLHANIASVKKNNVDFPTFSIHVHKPRSVF